MGRSQETFSKKEVRNKKEKRKKEKAEKRLAKKELDKSGKLEDMIAYVDEFGNISNTPPDPTKVKEEIDAENIEIGIPKREDGPPEEIERKGTVSFYNDSKGYGFIKDQGSQDSVFVHVNNTLDEIREGDKVVFEIEMGPKGPTAVKVKVV
ncbi:cold shock domain-containing protein [uncultured Arcticibacterium sp.]|uniref:cold-shock protein n=1 Tax=uncultured Arcticibacterium sp. TaxID=2173042 RepID=UPI0030F6BA48